MGCEVWVMGYEVWGLGFGVWGDVTEASFKSELITKYKKST